MTARFAHIKRLVALRATLRRFPDETDQQLKGAIIESLPPAYRKLYDWINQGIYGGEINTNMVMRAWDWKPNMASTALNELWQFGLLTREEYTDEHGKGYKYKVAEHNEST